MPLDVELMGLNLKNPVVVAAGPWARDGASIQRCVDAGAAAVTTETITLEANTVLCPRLYYGEGRLFNTKLYSDLHLEQWEAELEGVALGDCKLIASIWASSPSELAYLAARVERMGAHAVEFSISAPIGTRSQSINSHPDHIQEYIRAVRAAVDIPVMVKLSYEAAVSNDFTRSVEEAGAAAVSAIDALKGIQGVDLEARRTRMPTYGGYSGGSIRPVALAATATLKQYTTLQICAVGGISTCGHALEFLMLGAQAVQIGTAVQLEGCGVISRIISDLGAWLEKHGYGSVAEVRGAALPSLFPFEDIEPQPLAARMSGPCAARCGLCAAGCVYGAISRREGGYEVDAAKCRGCGLCAARCPEGRIRLSWA